MKIKSGLSLIVLAIMIASFAAADTTVVLPGDLASNLSDVISDPSSWFFYNDETDTINNSLGSFVNGPATLPAGAASVQISVNGTQRRNLATYQFSGTALADITELKFSTYNPSAGNGGSATRSAYLNFNVDFDGSDSWQKRLAYVPNKNGAVVQDTWQQWDAINAGNALWWWSGYAANGNKWPDGNTTEYREWSDLLAAFPNIAIRTTDSWLGLRIGEPYANGYTENIDAFVFGTAASTTTFDFELVPPDTDGDGVIDAEDLCPLTAPDSAVPSSSKGLGVNRWIWTGTWQTMLNKNNKGPDKSFTIAQTNGCNCQQILDIISADTAEDLTGQYKFGCSSGLIEDFVNAY